MLQYCTTANVCSRMQDMPALSLSLDSVHISKTPERIGVPTDEQGMYHMCMGSLRLFAI